MRDLLIGGILIVLVLLFLKSCADSAVEQQRHEDAARLEVIKDISDFNEKINAAWSEI
jgi:hypothetical protein